jgi:hypothetical protein
MWLDWNELLLNNTVSQVLPFWLLFVHNVWNRHYLLCRTVISLYQISDLGLIYRCEQVKWIRAFPKLLYGGSENTLLKVYCVVIYF